MALDFPTTDQSPFTAPNGVTYVYDGRKWVAADPATFLPISGGELTGDLTVPSLNGGQLAGFRNHIINGDFEIWQRGESIVAGSTFSADRWRLGGGAHTAQKSNFDVNIGVSGINVVHAAGGTAIFQGIELPVDGTTGKCGPFILNSVWTLSWYEPTAQLGTANQVVASVAFTDGTGGANPQAVTVGATASGEVVGNFTRRIAQVTISAGPVATNRCLRVGISTAGTDFQVFGIQFEPGPVATPFEHRPIGTELALCKRYFEKLTFPSDSHACVMATNPSNRNQNRGMLQFHVEKRAVPTITSTRLADAWTVNWLGSGSDANDLDFDCKNNHSVALYLLTNSNSGNHASLARVKNGQTADIYANAEL